MITRTLATIGLFSVALAAGVVVDMQASPHKRRPPPNVLIVVTDDQTLGMLSVMPQTRRYFAQQGTTFTHAFATTPVCCPSRASIFTGRYAHNHGVLTLQYGSQLDQQTTLQSDLQAAGYATALAGKYLNLWNLSKPPPYFDRWALFNGGYYDKKFNVDGTVQTVRGYTTDYISERSVRFLNEFERRDERPWFLYVAPFAPHSAFEPAPQYRNAEVPAWNKDPAVRETNVGDKPPYIRSSHGKIRRAAEIRRRRLRTLMSVDDLVSRTFKTLRALGEQRNTLAFFVSDNGWLNRQHGFIGKRPPYLDSVHVPLFARWPGHFAAGASDDRLVANIDLMPTVLDAAGIEANGVMDGLSLLDDSASRSALLLEQWRERGKAITAERGAKVPDWASTLTRTYQYIEYYGRGPKPLFREYYDLSSDPWQLRNLLGDAGKENDPDVAALSRRLARQKRCAGASCP